MGYRIEATFSKTHNARRRHSPIGGMYAVLQGDYKSIHFNGMFNKDYEIYTWMRHTKDTVIDYLCDRYDEVKEIMTDPEDYKLLKDNGCLDTKRRTKAILMLCWIDGFTTIDHVHSYGYGIDFTHSNWLNKEQASKMKKWVNEHWSEVKFAIAAFDYMDSHGFEYMWVKEG